MEDISDAIIPLIHPFRLIIAGPSGSGKSYFVKDLLLTAGRIDQEIDDIYYYFGCWQPLFENMGENVKFTKGLPSKTFYENLQPTRKSVIVLDDIMSEAANSNIISDLFTTGSHHKSISVVFIIQNLYFKAKVMRTVSLNASYIILYKNSRDQSQISVIARQTFPTNTKFVEQAFREATKSAYGYLLMDFRPETPDILRFRAKIFSQYPIVYLPD